MRTAWTGSPGWSSPGCGPASSSPARPFSPCGRASSRGTARPSLRARGAPRRWAPRPRRSPAPWGPRPRARRRAAGRRASRPTPRWASAASSACSTGSSPGRPGGVLLAGGRPLGKAIPDPILPLRTTIDPAVQRAATDVLAGRYGAVAALRPAPAPCWRWRAWPSRRPSRPAPPSRSSRRSPPSRTGWSSARPRSRSRAPRGWRASSSRTPTASRAAARSPRPSPSRATRCSPLGARLGARRLVAAAKRFGFNAAPPFAGAVASTIPEPDAIGGRPRRGLLGDRSGPRAGDRAADGGGGRDDHQARTAAASHPEPRAPGRARAGHQRSGHGRWAG